MNLKLALATSVAVFGFMTFAGAASAATNGDPLNPVLDITPLPAAMLAVTATPSDASFLLASYEDEDEDEDEDDEDEDEDDEDFEEIDLFELGFGFEDDEFEGGFEIEFEF